MSEPSLLIATKPLPPLQNAISEKMAQLQLVYSVFEDETN